MKECFSLTLGHFHDDERPAGEAPLLLALAKSLTAGQQASVHPKKSILEMFCCCLAAFHSAPGQVCLMCLKVEECICGVCPLCLLGHVARQRSGILKVQFQRYDLHQSLCC